MNLLLTKVIFWISYVTFNTFNIKITININKLRVTFYNYEFRKSFYIRKPESPYFKVWDEWSGYSYEH